jgi:serine phosphatase RsbU (regulator of sigma subunit)
LTKNLKKLLFQLHELPANEQKEKLLNTFVKFKGRKTQIDDILILGFSFD